MKLVVVEDSEIVRTQLLRLINQSPLLQLEGVASDEDSAVSLIMTARPDAVLLDLELSPGSGIRVMERIRSAGCTPQVLVLTNHIGDVARRACEALGARGFYDKSREVDACFVTLAAMCAVTPARSHTSAGSLAPPTDAVLAPAGRASDAKVSTRRAWRALAGVFMVACAALYWLASHEHGIVEARQNAWQARLGAIAHASLEARLTAIYRALDGLRDDHRRWAIAADRAGTTRMLQVLGDGMLGVRTTTMLDARGIVLASNRPELVGLDLSARQYFQAARSGNDPQRLYVSPPFTTALGAFALNLVRVTQDDQGRFSGIVAVTLDPAYFLGLLESLRPTPDAWAAIAHGNGTLFVTAANAADPARASAIARGFSHGQPTGDTGRDTNGNDDDDQIRTVRTVHPEALHMDAPLIIALGRDRATAFSGWRGRTLLEAALLALLSLASAASLHAFERRRREARAIHDRQTAERQLAADALAERERLLAESQAIAHVGSWVVDLATRRLKMSAEALRLCQLSPTVDGPTIEQALAGMRPDDRDKVRHWTDGHARAGQLPELELCTHTPKEEPRQLCARATLEVAPNGTPLRIVGTLQDVTEQRRNEQALLRHQTHLQDTVDERIAQAVAAEERLQMIIDFSADGIIELSSSGLVRMVNPAACEMLGYTPEELAGRNVHEAIHYRRPDGTDYPVSECAVIAAVAAGQKLRLDSDHLIRRDGSPLPVAIATHPILKGRGVTGAVMTFFDITDRMHNDEAQRAARATAEQATRAKSDFLAIMSHEIRTPLSGVLGLAQLGRRECAHHDRARKTFDRIIHAGRQLNAIIDDVLDFSKIEADRFHVDSVALDPVALIDEVTSAMRANAATRGLVLACDMAPGLPPACLGDPVRIRQVLLNLLSNAIKFTSVGEVRLRASVDGAQLVVSVSDTGIGIASNALGSLFQPFEQVGGGAAHRYGGTGLGLAISRRLAELMDGTLSVASQQGVGSTFTLRLPLRVATPRVATSAGHPADTGTRLAGLRLLVAEDTPLLAYLIDEFLRSEGAQTLMVENGQQAIDAVKQSPDAFDAVLMDVQMPDLDGIEATRQLRRIAPALAVIGQTGHTMQDDLDLCLAAGMRTVLTKPIDNDRLVRAILEQSPRQ